MHPYPVSFLFLYILSYRHWSFQTISQWHAIVLAWFCFEFDFLNIFSIYNFLEADSTVIIVLLVLRANLFNIFWGLKDSSWGGVRWDSPWLLLLLLIWPTPHGCRGQKNSWWPSLLSFFQNLEFSQLYHKAVAELPFFHSLPFLYEPVELFPPPPNAI